MLIFRHEAEQDIREAYAWYEQQQRGLDEQFLDQLGVTLNNIEENPELYARQYREIRRALCRRFPYSVYFIVTGEHDDVVSWLFCIREAILWSGGKELSRHKGNSEFEPDIKPVVQA